MKLINLTPHDVIVVADDGSEQTITYPRSGIVARATETRTLGHPLLQDQSIGTLYVEYTGVEDLPDPEPGTGYIASVLTVFAARDAGRTTSDLYYPGDLVRDIGGRVIGCRALYQLAESKPADAWAAAWDELTGYVNEAADNGEQLDPAEVAKYLRELRTRHVTGPFMAHLTARIDEAVADAV